MLNGKAPDAKKGDEIRKRMEKTLDDFELIWLKENKFLAGDKLTAADIWAACELEQPSKFLIFPGLDCGVRIFRNCWL